MITVKVFVDSNGRYRGFHVEGHSGYGAYGEDILCAAVSVLTQNTVNSIEALTEDSMTCSVSDGCLDCRLPESAGTESQLLMNAMMLGLESIEESYRTEEKENQYISISTEEV